MALKGPYAGQRGPHGPFGRFSRDAREAVEGRIDDDARGVAVHAPLRGAEEEAHVLALGEAEGVAGAEGVPRRLAGEGRGRQDGHGAGKPAHHLTTRVVSRERARE